MLDFNTFRLLEADDNPKVAQLEKQIRDKMNNLSKLKADAKKGKKGNEAKLASLAVQRKFYTELAALMNSLSGEISRLKPGNEASPDIY